MNGKLSAIYLVVNLLHSIVNEIDRALLQVNKEHHSLTAVACRNQCRFPLFPDGDAGNRLSLIKKPQQCHSGCHIPGINFFCFKLFYKKMETRDHIVNGAIPKSHTSRNFLKKGRCRKSLQIAKKVGKINSRYHESIISHKI
jgi:hypothetical protein